MIETTDRRDMILAAVAAITERLMAACPLPDRIDDVLEILGLGTAVDRAYLFEVVDADPVDPRVSQRAEWVAPGVEPQLDNPELQDLPLREAGFARWGDLLSRGAVVHGDVEEFPPEEQDLLRSQDIVSLVVVPVMVDGRWHGFLGFDATGSPRGWEPAEVEALRTAGSAIGASIARERLLEELQASQAAAEEALVRERRLTARLQQLDRVKDQFLEGVSHELRTPLAIVSGMLGLLQRHGCAIEGAQRDLLIERAVANADRLEVLVGQLLELKDLGHELDVPAPVHVDVATVLAHAVATSGLTADHPVAILGAPGTAAVDPGILGRIVRLVLDNVGRHTAAGTRSWIDAEVVAGRLHVTVADEGPGIAPADRVRVLEPFQQGATRRAHAPGIGVGLSLALNLARAHGGSLRLDDRPGGGTVVIVELAVDGDG